MLQIQKVIKVGNSMALTLDSKQAAIMSIKVGQELAVNYKPEKGVVAFGIPKDMKNAGVVMDAEKEVIMATKITPELQQWTDRFLMENEESMKKLADL